MTQTAPVDPLSHSVGSRVKPLFCCLDDFYGQHCARNFCDWSRMCEMVCRFWFVCHFLVAGLSHEVSRAGKSVRLWINLDANTSDHKTHPQTFASVLMRRRSLQLFSRLRRCRSFPGFSAVWTFDANSRMLQSIHHPEILEFQRLLPHRITIQTGKNSLVVLSSHQPECDDCQKTADFFSCLSISKLCLESCDRLLCATEGTGNPCVRNRETFSGGQSLDRVWTMCGT